MSSGSYSGVPRQAVAIPAVVRAVAAGRRVRPVWENELGGVTFEIGAGAGRSFVKWAPPGCDADLGTEATRLRWAAAYTPVPEVLEVGGDAEGTWMVTAGLAGDSAVSERWKAEPARAVEAIGAGLRTLHDALPVADCPFSWSAQSRLERAQRRAAAGGAAQRLVAVQALAEIPPVDGLVVCHGDPCAPNTLIDETGACSGHVDLGELGVADRWADLAVATWSTEWNYGPGWEGPLLDAYGIEPDPLRTRYYRLLWEAC